mmetsp:Transcript_53416/g.95854  ORF Transcript_53416/g.95854 Transcript_53416/m.95854 type:complete len:255 (+) Transcript_53416:70-834(+)|eukprot:CAMPEP_0197643178 /NCGR_PEP_ID=MMETSP1338-20131121/16597_1 /TAXON_ID=43686 ORGANISM="Pelagodinium beii, Strain RCC1491" /NCGR_SAMPLE_ID=MMETSP1338 /ASSEMBLY_ACC=CAM_ASM_000754 /LENGTH=254 /DNA_ID=CAMNT_0043216403 /DNA_START=70 /DNA_END=834 /DNA_ORIENTATION=-
MPFAPQHMNSGSLAVLGSQERAQHFKRTKLCKFNLVGACTRGASCNFAHSSEDMTEQPDYSKTRLCADFKLGKCLYDSNCKFAHGERELRRGAVARACKEAPQQPESLTMSQQAHLVRDDLQLTLATLAVLRAQVAHEKAAMSLLLQGASLASRTWNERKDCSSDAPCDFSRQTTLEPMDSVTSFSRSTSQESDDGDVPEAPSQESFSGLAELLPTFFTEELQITVKNTFIDVVEQDAQPVLRKSHSMPRLGCI